MTDHQREPFFARPLVETENIWCEKFAINIFSPPVVGTKPYHNWPDDNNREAWKIWPLKGDAFCEFTFGHFCTEFISLRTKIKVQLLVGFCLRPAKSWTNREDEPRFQSWLFMHSRNGHQGQLISIFLSIFLLEIKSCFHFSFNLKRRVLRSSNETREF